MAIPCDIRELESAKFYEGSTGKTTVRVGLDPGLPSDYESLSYFESASSVAQNITVTILSYTVPVGKTLILDKVEVGGENIAKYSVEFDAVEDAAKRTFWGSLNEVFNYDRYRLNSGAIIKVNVIHKRPPSADFEARLIGAIG